MSNSVIIAMWSGPRNISTAMMRAFENRPDTVVEDEPFYAHYLNQTGFNHPMRAEIINSQNLNWNKIANRLCSKISSNKMVWYQKHMTQHNLKNCDLDWTKNLTNCFLIRDPKEVINSYSKKNKLNSADQLGFKQQLELFDFLKENNNSKPSIVIDSKDVLLNPKEVLSTFCREIGIPFFEEMLSWPSGPRKTDGAWGKHWYKNVELSTRFNSYQYNQTELPIKYNEIYEECNRAYLELKKYKLKTNPLVSELI